MDPLSWQFLGDYVRANTKYDPDTDSFRTGPIASLIGAITDDEVENLGKVKERGILKAAKEQLPQEKHKYAIKYLQSVPVSERGMLSLDDVIRESNTAYDEATAAGETAEGRNKLLFERGQKDAEFQRNFLSRQLTGQETMQQQAAEHNTNVLAQQAGFRDLDSADRRASEAASLKMLMEQGGLDLDLAKAQRSHEVDMARANNEMMLEQARMLNEFQDRRYAKDRQDTLLMLALQQLPALMGAFT
jgi:hypothetical protein